ncbi:NAD(P)-dependent oxidoreductase [Pararhizobium haloflavum]|uniref:NAD(P)-dependent oxidoreductase n=1 Tax=Pararhizobium haloflavum TaxID=2037914 RepID=UPI000C1A156D|nr:NAD(P)-dependent oxidoreductase [Pararhizobium haloflavum]
MPSQGPIEGVYLSTALNLEKLFADAFAPRGEEIRLRRPEAVEDPAAVRFALCWHPADDAFDAYPNLSLAASIAAGVDNIVTCPSLPEDAVVTRVRDEHQADMMAGFAAWHVIWHHRNIGFHIEHQAKGAWARRDLGSFIPPRACTVGVLGFGLMGQAIARAIAAMGFPVRASVRNARSAPDIPGVTLEAGADAARKVAAASRILVNVLPLTSETRDILNSDLFAIMPQGSVLIQLGRGEHLVDADLDKALASGQLAGASLDVFRDEPLPGGHPWWSDPRILITPHQASDCSSAMVAEQVSRAARDVVAGRRPATAVDRKLGY